MARTDRHFFLAVYPTREPCSRLRVEDLDTSWLGKHQQSVRSVGLKSLMLFLQVVLEELGTGCRTSTIRDFKTISDRVEHEGLSFLTITLADFGKELEKALAQGHVGHDQFPSFRKAGGLPRFLGGFLDLVFDRATGTILEEPCVDAIRALRQITLMWAKMKLECSDERKESALRQYLQTEQEVRDSDRAFTGDVVTRFGRIRNLLWGSLLSDVDLMVFAGDLVPKHGPGATADGLRGNSKWQQAEWTERLEEYFPSGEFLLPNWRYWQQLSTDVTYLTPAQERPVKVILVPKTLKTPRVIAVEPTCMQYAQQALLDAILRAMAADKDQFATQLIGWTGNGQEVNNELARLGSADGSLATLDLSEASDRVSNQHVRALLSDRPHLLKAVDACRSRKADVLVGSEIKTIRLAKFASMGSALTFPIEAMVFATVVFMGIERVLGHQLTRQDVKSYLGRVRVYGDDIIVPADCAEAVVAELESFGFQVNKSKSFWTGKFRESCGREYYGGHDVSITRVRRVLPTQRQHVQELESTMATRNHLYKAGLWQSCAHLDRHVEAILGPLPIIDDQTSPLLGRHSFLSWNLQPTRLCPRRHVPLVKGYVIRSVLPKSPLGGTGALLKYLVKQGDLPNPYAKHLERAGRPSSVDIKRKWAPPF